MECNFITQDVFMKHYAHSNNKIWKEVLLGHGQGHKVIDLGVIWKSF